jgi:hypothetical protein
VPWSEDLAWTNFDIDIDIDIDVENEFELEPGEEQWRRWHLTVCG